MTPASPGALGLGALLFLLVCALYAPVGGFAFLEYDDPLYVTERDPVLDGLSAETLGWAFTSLEAGNWHPFTWLSHAATVEAFGLEASAHHWVNVVLHAATAALLWLVLLAATASPGRALFVAALFAVHPLRVESVAWIAERKDVLCGFFFVAAIGVHVAYARNSTALRHAAVLLAGAAALMSKAMAVTLPFVLLLVDVWPLARTDPWRRLVAEKLPLFALCVGTSVLAVMAQESGGAVASMEGWPLGRRVVAAFVAYNAYLQSFVWPQGLAVFYPHPIGGHDALRVAVAVATVSGLGLAALAALRFAPAIGVGLLWFFGTLVPVIGIVTVGEQAWADRYTYLPSIGLGIAVAWALPAVVYSRWAGRVALAGGVLALSAATAAQLPYWRDDSNLFARALAVTRDNRVAHLNYGHAIEGMGRLDEQRIHFERAIALGPEDALAHYNLARVLVQQGQLDLAIARYQAAAELDPADARVWNNLGSALVRAARPERAEAAYRRALALDPEHGGASFNLAALRLDAGDYAEGRALAERYLERNPEDTAGRTRLAAALADRGEVPLALQWLDAAPTLDADAHGLRAFLYWGQGREAEAIGEGERALELGPDSTLHQKNLAWMLATARGATLRDPARALALAREADAGSGGRDPAVLDVVAAAEAASGDFEAALRTLETAREAAQSLGLPEFVPVFEAREARYRDRQPHLRRLPKTPGNVTSPN